MSLFKRFLAIPATASAENATGEGNAVNMSALFSEITAVFGRVAQFCAHYKKYLLWGIALIVMSFFMVMSVSLFHRDEQLARVVIQLENKRTLQVRDQISEMRAQLEKITVSADSEAIQPELMKLDGELGGVEKSLGEVAKSAELEKISANIDDHFNNLEKSLAANDNAKQFVDAKSLPFSVISVDVIAQQAFVSVSYDHEVLPLGVGDSLAGWKLAAADYATSTVELVNAEGKYAKVTIVDAATTDRK